MDLARKERAAWRIYDTMREALLPVPWQDIGTEREPSHRHIGSSALRERIYQLVDEVAVILDGGIP